MLRGREIHLAKRSETRANNSWMIDTMTECPVRGMMVDEATAPSLEYQGIMYSFMSLAHKDMFEKDPGKYINDDSNSGPWKYLDAKLGRRGGCCG